MGSAQAKLLIEAPVNGGRKHWKASGKENYLVKVKASMSFVVTLYF